MKGLPTGERCKLCHGELEVQIYLDVKKHESSLDYFVSVAMLAEPADTVVPLVACSSNLGHKYCGFWIFGGRLGVREGKIFRFCFGYCHDQLESDSWFCQALSYRLAFRVLLG
jgi:hypothetical protein